MGIDFQGPVEIIDGQIVSFLFPVGDPAQV